MGIFTSSFFTSSFLKMKGVDIYLFICFILFALTSLLWEPYVVFLWDLYPGSKNIIIITWYWYANDLDPLFLEMPMWLRIMCGLDMALFGPLYLIMIYGYLTKKEWVKPLGLVFGSALLYSTFVYFGYEFIMEYHRANMWGVVLINIPYTIMPIVLIWRLWGNEPVWGNNNSKRQNNKKKN